MYPMLWASIAAGQLLDPVYRSNLCGLKDFGGTDRRFQYKGKIGDVTIIDDYAASSDRD